MALRYVDHNVAHCPRCARSHQFKLAIRSDPPEPAVPLFGGPGLRPASCEIAFTCPTTGALFTEEIPDPVDGTVVGPVDAAVATTGTTTGGATNSGAGSAPPPDADFADWAKSSRATAMDFCRTMLTTSTGAIAVYFAVLKYLGVERIGGALVTRVGILPPLLFLTASICFALAMRPRLATLTRTEFAGFRAQRLARLDRYITVGTALFAAGMGIAIVLFFRSLMA